jgi:hypothetical protein
VRLVSLSNTIVCMDSPAYKPSYRHLWRSGSSAAVDGQRLIEMLVEAISLYERHGVAISKSSKLHEATKLFEKAPRGEISASVYVSMAKLAFEHLSIARMLTEGGCSIDDVRTQLSHALSGGVVWKDDRDRRSECFQFELFVGSIFWMAGVKPEFREPDLVVELLGERVGVAVKYLFSNKRARKMGIRAVEQIRRCKMRGMLACGLSAFVPVVVKGKRDEDAGEPLDFSEVVPSVQEIDRAVEGEQGIIGRIAAIHTAAFQGGSGGGYMRYRVDTRPYLDSSQPRPLDERRRWQAELRNLQNKWSQAGAKMMTGPR